MPGSLWIVCEHARVWITLSPGLIAFAPKHKSERRSSFLNAFEYEYIVETCVGVGEIVHVLQNMSLEEAGMPDNALVLVAGQLYRVYKSDILNKCELISGGSDGNTETPQD